MTTTDAPAPLAAGRRGWPAVRRLLTWRTLGLAALAVVLLFVAAYPLVLLLVKSFQVSPPYAPVEWGFGAWESAFDDPSVPRTLLNTFSLGIVRVALAAALGIFFAWVVTRTTAPWRRFVELGLWLGFFLPLLPLTLGWFLLLDPKSGLLNTFLQGIFGMEEGPLDINSYWGIVWAHLAHSTAIMFLLITPAFQRLDAGLEEASWMSGVSRVKTLVRVTVPVLAPAILVATILILIRSFESFEIELLLGAPNDLWVFSTKVWLYLRSDPPAYGTATALSVVFLAVLIALIVLQRRLLGRRRYTTVGGRGFRLQRADLGRWRWPVAIFSAGFVLVGVFLPMILLVVGTCMKLFGFFSIDDPWTLSHWEAVLGNDLFVNGLKNTLLLGVGAAVVGAVFYLVVSHVLVREEFRGKRMLDFVSWLPWALPGVLISLALLWIVLGSLPFLTVLYGTIWVLILAVIVKNLPLGIQVTQASLMQMSPELEESAYTSGASRVTTFRRVVFPILAPGTLTVALIVFIEAVREIPAVIFLDSTDSRPLSPLMLSFAEEGRMEEAAIVGLVITVVIVVAAMSVRVIGKQYLMEQD